MGQNLKIREIPVTFQRKQTHELTKLLRSLTKQSEAAVAALVKLLDSADEKIVLAAAKSIVDALAQASDIVNKDDISRVLMELKHNPNGKKLTTDLEDEEEDVPSIDFHTIQQT